MLDSSLVYVFRKQEDGKRVAKDGGRPIIIGREWVDTVNDREMWRVRIVKEMLNYSIAQPVERIEAGTSTLAAMLPKETLAALESASKPMTVGSGAAGDPIRIAGLDSQAVEVTTPRTRAKPTHIQGMMLEPKNVVRATDRAAFFVDAANMDFAARDLGITIDWRRALDFFLGDGHFADAYYYTATFADDEDQRRFLNDLTHQGFIVRTKPVKRLGTRIKGNLDIEITLDMVAAADNYDVAFLFSGDSDFKRVVEVLQSRGKRVYVVSARGSVSTELRDIANKPLWFIEDFQEHIS